MTRKISVRFENQVDYLVRAINVETSELLNLKHCVRPK